MSITFDELKSAIEETIAEYGEDYVYKNPSGSADCLYVHRDSEGGGVPGCLIGHALHRLGVSLDELDAWEGATAETLPCSWWEHDAARYFAGWVQFEQDKGLAWGEALKVALVAVGH